MCKDEFPEKFPATTGDEHRNACQRNGEILIDHLQMLEGAVKRGKSIRLWMTVNEPSCGCTFWSSKPSSVFYKDGYVIFTDGGTMVAGELLYSMPILFPKLALVSAGRVEVEIVDISDDIGSPAYIFRLVRSK